MSQTHVVFFCTATENPTLKKSHNMFIFSFFILLKLFDIIKMVARPCWQSQNKEDNDCHRICGTKAGK
jgi:hypothetical protein